MGAEAAGDFAEDHAGPQGTLAFIVGGGHIAAGDEDKEITAAFADTDGEPLAGLGGGADGEQPVKPAVKVGTVLDQGGVLEIATAAANGNGALKQLVKARSEAGVSSVDAAPAARSRSPGDVQMQDQRDQFGAKRRGIFDPR